jgi:putative transcriptional regulator
MIRCHLARLLGERKLKIADVSRDTGINRGTLTRMYYETAERHDVAVLNVLCHYLQCAISDLLEYVEEGDSTEPKRLGPRRTA